MKPRESFPSPSDNGVLWIEGKSEKPQANPRYGSPTATGLHRSTARYIGFKMPAGVAADVTWTLEQAA